LATRRKSTSSNDALQESVDRLSTAFERMADKLETIGTNGGYPGNEDRVMLHARRYLPFYALAAVFAIFMFALPTKTPSNEQAQNANQLTPGTAGSQDFGAAGSGSGVTASGTGTSGVGGTKVAGNGVTVPAPGQKPIPAGLDPLAWNKTGKTVGGFDCKPGVRQLPWSAYAVPCHPAYTGGNAGATTRGVTDKEIVVVRRYFPDSPASQAVDAFVQQAGFASADELAASRREFVKYFNKVFELWGRKVRLVEYLSENGDSTQESLSQGKEGACADADAIIAKYKPYMVFGAGATGVFGECAAVKKLVTFDSGAYYPEWWYAKYHPYLWAGVMECTRISFQGAEWLGKRVVNRPAKWARGAYKGLPRKLGIYVPDNDKYATCVANANKVLKSKYNYEGCDQCEYHYALDVQRFPDEAARAIVQFNAAGVTTVYLACDPLSPIFLTQSAAGQNYYPEWITNGAGLTDVDQFARLWDQSEIQWALWGQSQLGDNAKILGPKGEGTISYKKGTGRDIPPGAQTLYYEQLRVFSILQAMGPTITPEHMADTFWRLPPGGAPLFEVGYTSYLDGSDGSKGTHDHTAVDDMREIYWLCTDFSSGDAGGSSRCTAPKGYDGKGGVYVATMNGKRFRNGEWPTGEPPVFPEKK
jgi:hypothetical protein